MATGRWERVLSGLTGRWEPLTGPSPRQIRSRRLFVRRRSGPHARQVGEGGGQLSEIDFARERRGRGDISHLGWSAGRVAALVRLKPCVSSRGGAPKRKNGAPQRQGIGGHRFQLPAINFLSFEISFSVA